MCLGARAALAARSARALVPRAPSEAKTAAATAVAILALRGVGADLVGGAVGRAGRVAALRHQRAAVRRRGLRHRRAGRGADGAARRHRRRARRSRAARSRCSPPTPSTCGASRSPRRRGGRPSASARRGGSSGVAAAGGAAPLAFQVCLSIALAGASGDDRRGDRLHVRLPAGRAALRRDVGHARLHDDAAARQRASRPATARRSTATSSGSPRSRSSSTSRPRPPTPRSGARCVDGACSKGRCRRRPSSCCGTSRASSW